MSYKSFSKQQDTLGKKDENEIAGEPASKHSAQRPDISGPPVKPSEAEPTPTTPVQDA